MDNDILELKDLSVAAYLYSTNQVRFIGKRRIQSGEVFFQFTPKEIANSLIKRYWNSEAPPIQPKQLFNAVRDLKDIIYGS